MIFLGAEWNANLAMATKASVVITDEPITKLIRVGSWPKRREYPTGMAEARIQAEMKRPVSFSGS